MMTPSSHLDQLEQEVVLAVVEGCDRIVVWGVSPDAARLIGRLRAAGLVSGICAVVGDEGRPSGGFCGIPLITAAEIEGLDPDALVIVADAEKEEILTGYVKNSRSRLRILFAGDGQYSFRDPVFSSILRSCPVKPKAWGYRWMLVHLFQALRYLASREISGDVAEFGVLHGGTTVFLAKAMELPSIGV